MGRGRQKAKHTKVARQLKYFSPETDYRALERELAARTSHADPSDPGGSDVRDDMDQYAEWSSDDR